MAPLLKGIGEHHFAITTDNPEAQQYFDQGLILHYGFNDWEALRSFKEAARLDPECAMCYWGQALVTGPKLNHAMTPEEVPRSWGAIQKALELDGNVSQKERDLIEALASRYAPEPPDDRSALDAAYSGAMREVADRYSDDSDARTLYAEALMCSTPWDYWSEEGEPKEGTLDVLTALEAAMEVEPENPGANHFYIHAVEAVRPELALDSAKRLETAVPVISHLVHMPSHIYLRTGRYHDATIANERAMESDLSYEKQIRDQGLYPLMYMPHNAHFLCYTAAMEGRKEKTLGVARQMAAGIDPSAMRKPGLGTLQHYWVTPLFAMVRFGMWEELLSQPIPDEDLIYPRGVYHYARGMALARTGRAEEAEAELEALRPLAEDPSLLKVTIWDLNSTDSVLGIAAEVLAGEIAVARGDPDASIQHLERAVEFDDQLNYDEPPPWHLPTRQLLGAELMEAGRLAEAEQVYRADLVKYPENGWSLYGLFLSLEAQGKAEEANQVEERFDAAWQHADIELTASRL